MSFKFLSIFLCFFLYFKGTAYSQKEIDPVVENIIESISERISSDDIDISDLTDQLYYHKKHPINLNKTSKAELKSLYILNELQINAIEEHIQKYGQFLDLLELQTIPMLDNETIRKLASFVTVQASGSIAVSEAESELVIRASLPIENKKGFELTDKKSVYQGNRLGLYSRYSITIPKKLSINLLAEKDPGEAFFSRSQPKGFDFYSGNITIQNQGIIKQLIIGDYLLQFGQGLTMWNGYSLNKSAMVLSMAKSGVGNKPYRSAAENGFFRGVSARIEITEAIKFTPFISYRKLDAYIETDSVGNGQVSSIIETGYHRSTSEISDQKKLKQLVYGGNLNIKPLKNLTLELTVFKLKYDLPINSSFELYNQFLFRGKSQPTLSIAYTYPVRNFYFFGEASKQNTSKIATINGVLISLSKSVTLLLQQRKFPKDYSNTFANPIAESSTTTNEEGLYSGLTIRFSKKLEYSTYADFFRSTWLRYRVDAPSTGHELFSQIMYAPSSSLSFKARYRSQQKQGNLSNDESTITPVELIMQNNFRFQIDYRVSERLSFRNRIDYCKYKIGNAPTEQGYSISLDVNYILIPGKWQFNARYALFDTDSYNSRIYASEKDVLYGYSLANYYDAGNRFYINSSLKVYKNLTFWIKYGIYSYQNKEIIGSGYDEIAGNHRSDIKTQIALKF